MNPVLKVRDVCLSYHTLSGETPALSHISFDLMPGEFLSIVGPSGCGKSTLLNLIAGLLTPEHGSITLGGRPVSSGSAAVGYMLQKDHLLEWRSIYKNHPSRPGDPAKSSHLKSWHMQKPFFRPTVWTVSVMPALPSFPAVCANVPL